MNEFRVFLSVVIFCICSYLVFDLFVNGFNWATLIFSLGGYISIHFIWPKHKESESIWYELLESVVEFPFRAIAFFIRSIGRIFKNSDGDIGIDL